MIKFIRSTEEADVLYAIPDNYLPVTELLQHFRHFLLALGYPSESVDNEIEAE